MARQRAMMTHTDDEGATWSEPIEVAVSPTVDGKPGIFRMVAATSLGERHVLATLCWVDHSDPSLPFFNENTEGLLDTRIFLAESEDDGATYFYDKNASPIRYAPGDIAFFFPNDAHSPRGAVGGVPKPVNKVVFKVKL